MVPRPELNQSVRAAIKISSNALLQRQTRVNLVLSSKHLKLNRLDKRQVDGLPTRTPKPRTILRLLHNLFLPVFPPPNNPLTLSQTQPIPTAADNRSLRVSMIEVAWLLRQYLIASHRKSASKHRILIRLTGVEIRIMTMLRALTATSAFATSRRPASVSPWELYRSARL